MLTDEQVVVANRDFHVTESVISPRLSLTDLLVWIRDNRKTGDIRYVVNQGGVQQAIFIERSKIPEAKRQAVRDMLNGAL